MPTEELISDVNCLLASISLTEYSKYMPEFELFCFRYFSLIRNMVSIKFKMKRKEN